MEIEIEELRDEKDLVRKDQLLQKYGIIPPKLTETERLEVLLSEDEDGRAFVRKFYWNGEQWETR